MFYFIINYQALEINPKIIETIKNTTYITHNIALNFLVNLKSLIIKKK